MEHSEPDKTDLEEYQSFVEDMTWDSTKKYGIYWTALALTSEVGEVCQILEKIIRKNNDVMTEDHRVKLKEELGDVLWNVVKMVNDINESVDEVMEDNIQKLNKRVYGSDT